jgi:sensor domain CHASE-containing protein
MVLGMELQYLVAPLVTVLGLVVTILTLTNSNKTLRAELKGDISELRSELKGEIAGVRTELKGDIYALSNRVTSLEDRMYHLTLALAGYVKYAKESAE